MIRRIPKSIQELSNDYMEQSDPFVSWMQTRYKKTENKKDIIKLKDLYQDFMCSYLYENFNKNEKRKMNYKKMCNDIENHPILRIFYKKRVKLQGMTCNTKCLTNFVKTDTFEDMIDENE